MERVFAVLTLIIIAVMVADLVANPKGTLAIAAAMQRLWSTSLNAELGRPS
jgi:hypothetical protein